METKSEKKNRLSRLLGTKRDKSQEPQTVLPDSAYASSETPSGEAPKDVAPSSSEVVPAEKNSEIANIDRGRNLGIRPATGEVLDQDTGEVVTVVTTTTTTTTTTTRKPGRSPDVSKDVQREVQEITPGGGVPTISGPSEMPANNTVKPNRTIMDTVVPERASSRPQESPPIPTRSTARKSQEFGNRQSQVSTYPAYDENLPPPTGGYYGHGPNDAPPSPINNNFSYPSRGRTPLDPVSPGPTLSTMDSPQRHNRSTVSDLKAAAKGIHGVGETLRGTLNAAVDQNFPRKNEQKAAYANAKNEEAIARGRAEMERANVSRTRTSEQVIPGGWSEEEIPPTGYPATDPVEVEQREKQKARSIGKLFKRKPVGEEGGLRVTNP